MRFFIFLSLILFHSCSESKTDKRSGKSSTEKEKATESETTSSQESTTEYSSQEENSSAAAAVYDEERGINIFAPDGLVAQKINPKIKLDKIREEFTLGIPGSAVLLGQGSTITLTDEDDHEIDASYLKDNYSVHINIDEEILSKKNNLGIVVRTMDDEGNEKSQLITQSDLLIRKNIADKNGVVSFKASGSTLDFQMVEIKNSKLTETEIYYPRPKNPEQLECTPASSTSISLNWGLPGGSVSAFKIVYSEDKTKIENDIGCDEESSIADLTGISRSYLLSNLHTERTYYFRVCAKNNRIPTDSSPGLTCEVTTPSPDIPTLHLVYGTADYDMVPNTGVFYGVKTVGNWSLYKISDHGDSGQFDDKYHVSFDLDKNNFPHVALTRSLQIYHGYIKNGNWIFEEMENGDLSETWSELKSYNVGNNPNNAAMILNFTDGFKISRIVNDSSTLFRLNPLSETTLWPILDKNISTFDDVHDSIKFLNYMQEGGAELLDFNHGVLTRNVIENESCPNVILGTPNGQAPAIAIDKNSDNHLAYYCLNASGKCGLYHTRFDGTGWNNTFVDEVVNDMCGASSLIRKISAKVAEDLSVHIVYQKNDPSIILPADYLDNGNGTTGPNALQYAYKNAGNDHFTITQIDQAEYTGEKIENFFESVIAVDKKNKAHIVYSSLINYDSHDDHPDFYSPKKYLYYITNINGTWQKTIVDSGVRYYSQYNSYYIGDLIINDMPSRSYREP